MENRRINSSRSGLYENDVLDLVRAHQPSVQDDTALNEAQPNNVFPLPMFAAPIEVARKGVYLARVTANLNTDNGQASGGTFLSNNVVVRFTVNGDAVGGLGVVYPRAGIPTVNDESPYVPIVYEQRLELQEGDQVGVSFGFLVPGKTTDLKVPGGRVLSLQLTSGSVA